MLIACWSTKGGAGTTVVAAALGVLLARRHPTGALLVDVGGDLPAALGLAPLAPDGAEEVAVGGLPLALRSAGPGAADLDVAALAGDRRAVVADCGRLDLTPPAGGLPADLVVAADRSLLVLRPCYLALRRAVAAPVRPTGVVVVVEPGRAITADDIADALGVPVVAEVQVTEAVARAVDAGLLVSRVPRSLLRDLRGVA